MRRHNDRHGWYGDGASDEELFCFLFGHTFGLSVNPAKADDPTVPDLVHRSGEICELKTRRTPFFTAYKTYGIPIQHAVTINRNDVERYRAHYPTMPIYFWVNWTTFSMGQMLVKPMFGVWGIRVMNLCRLCTDDNLHKYQGRVDDTEGNAKDSYVLSLLDMKDLMPWESL